MKKLYILSLATAFFIHNMCSDPKVSTDTSAIKESPTPSLKTLPVDPGLLGTTTPPAEQNNCPVYKKPAVSYLQFIIGSKNHFNAFITSISDFNIDNNTGILNPTLAATYNYAFKGNEKQNAKINIPLYNIIKNPFRQTIKFSTNIKTDKHEHSKSKSEIYDIKNFKPEETYTLSLAQGKITVKDSKGNVIAPGVQTLKKARDDAARKAATAKQ